MKQYAMHVQRPYWDALAAGAKTVEGRIAKPKYDPVLAGDLICFSGGPDGGQCLTRIVEIQRFSDFYSMLHAVGVKACVPGAQNLDEAVAIYHSFPGYEENAKKHGVLAFVVELI